MARFVVVMGVSGSGKTTVGLALAERLGVPFYDADAYHPQANIAKMASGVPLDDGDRAPWLERLRALIAEQLARGRSGVLACSALKRSYREILASAGEGVVFLYLEGSPELLEARLREREGHYMKAGMLASQFEALEPPAGAITIGVSDPVGEIVARALAALGDAD